MKNVNHQDDFKMIKTDAENSKEQVINSKKENDNSLEKVELMTTNVLFSIMMFFTAIGTFLMIVKLDDFLKPLKEFNKDYIFPEVYDFKLTIIFIPFVIYFKIAIEKLIYPVMRYMSKEEYLNPEDTQNYAIGIIYTKKNCTNFFKLTYYIIVVIIGHYVLKELDYFPTTLLGSGEVSRMFEKGYPEYLFHFKTKFFDYYYLGTLSFHIVDLIWLVAVYELQSDFLMMLLHHICTVSLITFSYLSNYTNVGCIVLFLHDVGDIFVYITRIFLNTRCLELVKVSSGVVLLIFFIYTRIYVFGDLLVKVYYGLSSHFNWVNLTLWGFLCFLYVLHIYWVYLILKKIFTALFMKRYEDSFKVKKST